MSLANLKKSSSLSISALKQTIESTSSKKSYTDDRFYVPNVDKNGNNFVLIRLLPELDGERPFEKVFSHSFKTQDGRWYIENCRTTLGDKCSVCEDNGKKYNSGSEQEKNIAQPRSRRTTYISNILVISDQLNPENNGKNFLWKYGKKIFEKINQEANPLFPNIPECNVFDFWQGKTLKLMITNVGGFRNYDMSSFENVSALFDGDDSKLEALYAKQYSLNEFISEENFKPKEELDKKFRELYPNQFNSTPVATSAATASHSTPSVNTSTATEDDDDDMALYRELLG